MAENDFSVPIGFKFNANAVTLNPSNSISEDSELEVRMTELYTVNTHTDSNGVKCRIIQGACTDGEYLYTCLNDGASSGAVTTIVKTELVTGKVVARYENIMIDHANGFTKQGMDADDKYIYFVLYNTNCIAVYTKDGKYVRQIDLPVTAGEPENISHVGDLFYIVYNNPSWTGGIVYEVKITAKK